MCCTLVNRENRPSSTQSSAQEGWMLKSRLGSESRADLDNDAEPGIRVIAKTKQKNHVMSQNECTFAAHSNLTNKPESFLPEQFWVANPCMQSESYLDCMGPDTKKDSTICLPLQCGRSGMQGALSHTNPKSNPKSSLSFSKPDK